MVASFPRSAIRHADDQGRSGARGALLLVTLVTALVYVAAIFLSVRPYHGNLSSLIHASRSEIKADPGAVGRHIVVYRNETSSYDGLSYYFVAADPLLRHRAYRDAFRYQRIGYPLVVWAVSLGRLAWRPAAMVGVNLVAVLCVAYLSGLIIRDFGERRTSVWWALACAINPMLLIGVQYDLGEPLTIALSIAGLLLYLRRRLGWAALVFAAALLARDVAILFLLPLLAAELLGRRWRQSLILALPVIPYVIWAAVVAHILGHTAVETAGSNFGVPFGGIAEVAGHMLHATSAHRLGWASILAVAAVSCAALAVSLVRMLRGRSDVVTGGIAAHGIAAILGSWAIWVGFLSAARVFGGLYPLSIFAFARYRGAFGAIAGGVIALTLFTLYRYVLHNPVSPYYLTP